MREIRKKIMLDIVSIATGRRVSFLLLIGSLQATRDLLSMHPPLDIFVFIDSVKILLNEFVGVQVPFVATCGRFLPVVHLCLLFKVGLWDIE